MFSAFCWIRSISTEFMGLSRYWNIFSVEIFSESKYFHLEAAGGCAEVWVAAVAVAALHLALAVPDLLGYSLLQAEEVLLGAEADGGDGLLDHGAVTPGQQTAGHALREILQLLPGTRLGRKIFLMKYFLGPKVGRERKITLSSLPLRRSQE